MAGEEYSLEHLHPCQGIYNSVADSLIPDGHLADARNVMPNPSGAGNIIKRLGYAEHLAGVSAKLVRSIYSGLFNRYFTTYDAGTAKDFCIYDLDDGTELYSDTAPALKVHWASMDGFDLCVNTGPGYLKTLTGAAASFTSWTGPPAGLTCIEVYNNMCFGITTDSTPAGLVYLYWSNIADPETWPATNSYAFNTGPEMEWPTAIKEFGDVLVFFTNRALYQIQAFSPIDVSIPFKRRDIGCIGKNAVVSTPYGLIWWSPAHGLVVSADGGRTIDYCMQRKLLGTFKGMVDYQLATIHMIWRPDLGCVRVFLPSSASGNFYVRLDYYPGSDSFWLHTLDNIGGAGTRASCVYQDSNFGGATFTEYGSAGIKVLKEGTTAADLTSAVSDYITMKRQSVGGTLSYKHARNVILTTKMAASEAITYSYFVDNATSASGTHSITPATGVVDTVIGLNAKCRKLQHRIADAGSGRNEYYLLTEGGHLGKTL